MFKSVLAAAALVAAATPALAQDAPNTFNGPYVGVQAGWQQDRQTLNAGTTSTSNNTSGFAYGAQIGYDFRLGDAAVLGVEVDITGTTGSTSFTGFDINAGRTISSTLRAGYLLDPQGLLYVRGGYRNARFTIDNTTGNDVSSNRDGWTIGAGYERYITPNISGRLEYNYTGLGNDALPSTNVSRSVDYQRHAITAGVNYRF
jgi:outer membrane immunogenic protein